MAVIVWKQCDPAACKGVLFIEEKRYQSSPDYIRRQIAGADILISVGANIADFNGYIQLNPTGAFIWDNLSSPVTAAELTARICEEYETDPETAAADVRDFLQKLISHGMAVIV